MNDKTIHDKTLKVPETSPASQPHIAYTAARAMAIARILYRNTLAWMVLALGLQVLVVMIIGVAWVIHDDVQYDVVVQTLPAGKVIAAGMQGGLLNRGWVETDQGYFFLIGPMSVVKGDGLGLQVRGNRSRLLCDASQNCVKLLSNWR